MRWMASHRERRQPRLIDKLLTFRNIAVYYLVSRKTDHSAMVASIASPIVNEIADRRRAATCANCTFSICSYSPETPEREEMAKWREGPAQPFEKARFAEGKSLDFPSLRLGFSFPRFAQKENSAVSRNSMNNNVNSPCVNALARIEGGASISFPPVAGRRSHKKPSRTSTAFADYSVKCELSRARNSARSSVTKSATSAASEIAWS